MPKKISKVTIQMPKRRQQRAQRARKPRITVQVPARSRPPAQRRRNNRRNGGGLASLGRGIGGIFGPMGRRVGGAIGGGLSHIMGSGDYIVSGPVGANSLAGSSPPQFGSSTGTTIIRHREYVADIFSSTNFLVRSYPLTPGVSQLFPWLSRIAANYEQYRFRGLVVEIKTTSSNALNSTNTALGVVGVATQYDADEPDFLNKQEAENYIGCQSTNPSTSILHFVECARGQNVLDYLYTRTGNLGADQDIKFYDLGKLQIFTQGMQAAGVNIGELWVSYDLEFTKPKLPSGGVTQTVPCDVFERYIGTPSNWSGASSGTLVAPSYGNIGSTLNTNTITFPQNMPPGRYELLIDCMLVSGTGAGSVIATGANLTGAATLAAIYPTSTGQRSTTILTNLAPTSGYMSTKFAFDLGVQTASNSTSLTLVGQNFAGTGAAAWYALTQIVPVSNYSISSFNSKYSLAKIDGMMSMYGIDMKALRSAVKWYEATNPPTEEDSIKEIESR